MIGLYALYKRFVGTGRGLFFPRAATVQDGEQDESCYYEALWFGCNDLGARKEIH